MSGLARFLAENNLKLVPADTGSGCLGGCLENFLAIVVGIPFTIWILYLFFFQGGFQAVLLPPLQYCCGTCWPFFALVLIVVLVVKANKKK